jgi:hypothetical protein
MMHRFYSLYASILAEIHSAKRLVKLGDKDGARERLRFIQYSGVIAILKEIDFPETFAVNLPLLEWKLKDVLDDIHPDDISSDRNLDLFQQILSRLDLIAHHVSATDQQFRTRSKARACDVVTGLKAN